MSSNSYCNCVHLFGCSCVLRQINCFSLQKINLNLQTTFNRNLVVTHIVAVSFHFVAVVLLRQCNCFSLKNQFITINYTSCDGVVTNIVIVSFILFTVVFLRQCNGSFLKRLQLYTTLSYNRVVTHTVIVSIILVAFVFMRQCNYFKLQKKSIHNYKIQ